MTCLLTGRPAGPAGSGRTALSYPVCKFSASHRGARRGLLLPLMGLLLVGGCGAGAGDDLPLNWRRVEAPELGLPEGVELFEGHNPDLPLRAWYARIAERDPVLETRVLVSTDTDRRETPAEFAARTGAALVINAGYFQMGALPAEHVGLLHLDGHTVAPSAEYYTRSELRYPTVRAALGLDAEGGIDVAWAASRGDTLFEWPAPLPNRLGQPAAAVDFTHARPWPVRDAVAAGPALLAEGRVAVSVDEEVFFGSSIPQVHPRTAAGYTRRGDLVLLVVDGRQPASRGVDLRELATIMRELDCIEALNLDGGGSSALVAGGVLLNRPAGGTVQREVMSVLAVFAR